MTHDFAAQTRFQKRPSLYERLGGQKTLTAAVERMYARLQLDPRMGVYFDEADMTYRRESQLAFLTLALGGLNGAKTQRMVQRGMEDVRFKAAAGYLAAAFGELRIDNALIREVLAKVETGCAQS